MKQANKSVVLAASVLLLLVCIFAASRYVNRRARTHGPHTWVPNEISQIHFILKLLYDDHREELSSLLLGQSNQLARTLYAYAYQKHADPDFFPDHPDWKKTNAFVDPWDKPYNFFAWTNAEVGPGIYIHIWSSGPNGVNENRKGDDVSLRFSERFLN